MLIIAINGNSIEYLVEAGYPTSLIMVFRGGFAFVLCTGICLFTAQPLFPTKWKYQVVRLINNGISALLLFESYKFLSASSVGLISRVDVPFLILLYFFRGEQKSNLQLWLSLWTIAMIGFLILDARFIDEVPIGFLYALGSVVLVSVSYIMIKKSVETESAYVLSNVNSISYMAVGCFVMFSRHLSWHIGLKHLWIFAITGLMQFATFVIGVWLYKWYSAEKARFPFVIGAIATMGVEMIIEQKWFGLSQIGLSLLLTGMILTISLDPKAPKLFFGAYYKLVNLKSVFSSRLKLKRESHNSIKEQDLPV